MTRRTYVETAMKAEVANGKKEVVPYVGPVKVSCLGRSCYAGALVLGDRVLLGAVPMQDMDLVISPTKEQVTPNPGSPNIPSAIVVQTPDEIRYQPR